MTNDVHECSPAAAATTGRRPHECLETRIAALERRGRLLGACVLALLACGALLAAAPGAGEGDGARDVADVLRARRVELLDAEGRVRAELAIDADGSAGLFVRDAAARLRASVTHDDAQTALCLWDGEGAVRVGVAQFAHGGGGVALHGPAGKGDAVLFLKDEASLTFYDEAGAVIERVGP